MGDKKKIIDYWINSAESDLLVAESLFSLGHYHYCLFLGHLVLEKALKALYVKKVGDTPPYKHSLVYLAEKSLLGLTEDQLNFLEIVTDFNIEARYPDEKMDFFKMCTKEFSEKYFQQIKEFYKWLKTLIQ